MTPEQAAYAAGFFDGEGSIAIHRTSRNLVSGGTNWHYQVSLTVAQTSEPVLRRLQEWFGGSVTRRAPSPPRKQAWVWTIQAQMAKAFIIAVRPHLVVKADEADIALDFQRLIDAWCRPEGRLTKRTVTPDELDRRESLRLSLLAHPNRGTWGKRRRAAETASQVVIQ